MSNVWKLGEKIATLPGILLLAHGGPGSLEDVPAFLERLRGGRPFSQEMVARVQEKYRSIGGASPLPAITRNAAAKLEKVCGLPVYVGMLHWPPLLEDVVPQMVVDGVPRALAICLIPHFSRSSVGRYQRKASLAADGGGLALEFVDSWCTLPPFIAGLTDSIVTACNELGLEPGVRAPVIFSAHSLPRTALAAGDPYEQQLRETAELVAGRLGLPDEGWTVAFQSVGGPAEEWLGPSVDEAVSELAERGESRVVLCPFGFVADQVEILYDLDVVTKQKAGANGVTLARTPLLNDGPALIDSLALLVDRWAA